MRDPRIPEIAWLLIIIFLVAAGGPSLLHALAMRRLLGALVLAIAVAGTILMIRRAYAPQAPTVRADVTKGVAYCCAAVLGFVAIAAKQHWAIGACIIALEASLVFDITTIMARPRTASEK